MKKSSSFSVLQLYFWIVAASALAALTVLFAQPSEAASVWLLGLSKTRALLAAALLLWIFAAACAAVLVRRSARWRERLLVWARNRRVYRISLVASLTGLFVGTQLWYLANIALDPYVRGLLARLVPLLLFATSFSLQNLLLLPLLRHGWDDLRGAFASKTLRFSGPIFGLFLLLWAIIALTGLGLNPDAIGWDAPGAPLSVGAVAGVWGLALGWPSRWNGKKSLRIDLAISLLIWLAAVLLWQSVPMQADYFAPAPQPPNFEFYPHSDAALHDIAAQRLWIGAGFDGIARKPLYSVFLAVLHGLAGENYAQITRLQVMALALLPLVFYWITKTLHLRVSGLIAAALLILRERNALLLSGTLGVSNVKLLMSDLPAALGVMLLTALLLYWLRQPAQRRAAPLAIGGVLGLLLLIRPQIVVFVPVVFLLILLASVQPSTFNLQQLSSATPALVTAGASVRHSSFRIHHSAFFILGFALTLAPWLWRSHQIIGQFALNDPNQNAFLTQQYSLTPGESRMTRQPGESDGEFAQRIDAYLSDFMRQNPAYVAGFITRHFAHNWIEAVITLPLSPWLTQSGQSDLFPYWRTQADDLWADCCSPAAYVAAQPFWDNWQGALSAENALMLTLNLGLLALGLSAAWRRGQLTGWLPLGVAALYIFSTAVGRYSGWRLLLPADWVVLLYFAIGLGQSVVWAKFYFDRRPKTEDGNPPATLPGLRSPVSGLFLGLFFLALGFSPLMMEHLIPRPDSPFPADIRTTFELIPEIEPLFPSVESLLEDERAILLEGRVLYPRFYLPNEGEPGNEWTAFSPHEYRRLGFVLLDSSYANIVMPLDEAPAYFPHAADALVLGCDAGDHISARLVVLHNEDGYTTLRSSSELSCDVMP